MSLLDLENKVFLSRQDIIDQTGGETVYFKVRG